jgi:hypothetical protein
MVASVVGQLVEMREASLVEMTAEKMAISTVYLSVE